METKKRSIKKVYFVVAVLLGSSVALQSTPAVSRVDAAYTGSSQTTVLCPAKGVAQVNVYSEKLVPTGKKVDAFSSVQVFQGWGTNEKTATVRGSEIRFVRIQIPGVSGNHFVRELEVTTTAACQQRRGESPKDTQEKKPAANEVKSGSASNAPPVAPTSASASDEVDEEDETEESEQEPVVDINLETIIARPPKVDMRKGLKSSACCLFPLVSKPTSYLSGKGRFGAGRRVKRGTRIHAGADLYGKHGQTVRSVSDGVVVRAPYYFKGKTLAVDVRHSGGFVVRYGEIMTGNNLKVGKSVTRGSKIGQIKKLPCCSPMLHFELYTGSRTGKLSQRGTNKYHRRADLIDPTPYLKKWSVK